MHVKQKDDLRFYKALTPNNFWPGQLVEICPGMRGTRKKDRMAVVSHIKILNDTTFMVYAWHQTKERRWCTGLYINHPVGKNPAGISYQECIPCEEKNAPEI